VLNWATRSRDRQGNLLLIQNPLKGLTVPKEEAPRRPAISDAEFQAMLGAAKEMDWRFRLMLVLVHETGHRIGAVLELRWSDIDLQKRMIRWRGEKDKIRFEHSTPMSGWALEVLADARREHPASGDAWVFPSPADPTRPCSRYLAKAWWKKAERRLGWKHTRQMGWHSLRRKFATEMKDLPLKDLCHLGGWKNHNTVLICYQQPDEERMREALAGRRRLGGTGTER
jgi:integrase